MENDIINRYKIKKAGEFRKVANFVLISNSRIYSAKSIADFMKSANHQCTSNTVQKWISYLNEAFVIDQADRYSLKAKKVPGRKRQLQILHSGSIQRSRGKYLSKRDVSIQRTESA